MRSILLLVLVSAVGWAAVALLAYVVGLSVGSALAGAAGGIAWMVVASASINTINAARRDDDDDLPVWGGMDGLELHAEHMRRDRVRRHSENASSIPVGEPS
jgi:hypothetical protein